MNEHYDPEAVNRFNDKWIETPSGCHEWQSEELNVESHAGRPRFWHKGKPHKAYRWIFWQTNGFWPVVARHTCDNGKCVNPAHIIDGTQEDNMRDKMERGRTARGERSGLSKLKLDEVKAIWQACVEAAKKGGGFPYAALANEYGVTQSTIRNIVSGRTWSDITHNEQTLNGEPVRRRPEPTGLPVGTHRRKSTNAASRFKGVGRDKSNPHRPWAAYIKHNSTKRRLGRFATEEEAAKAYDAAARKEFGSAGRFNFPNPGEMGI